MIERGGKQQLLSLTDDGRFGVYDGYELVEAGDFWDEDVKNKMGCENLKLKPKAVAWNKETNTLCAGFEQNIIIKMDLKNQSKEVLISGYQ